MKKFVAAAFTISAAVAAVIILVEKHKSVKKIAQCTEMTARPLPSKGLSAIYEFKNWAIACDNTAHCEAVGSQNIEDESLDPVQLWLARDAGPNQEVTGRIIAIDEAQDDAKGNLTLTVNGDSYIVNPDSNLSHQTLMSMLPKMLAAPEATVASANQQ